MVNNLSAEFSEGVQEAMDDFRDLDVTLEDGLEEESWDEDHALDMVLNDMVEDLEEELEESQEIEEEEGSDIIVGMDMPRPTEPSVISVESNLRLEDILNPGLIERKIEKRKVRKIERNPNRAQKVKKGPLWDFRTNRNNDHLRED